MTRIKNGEPSASPGMEGIDEIIALPGPEGSPGISVNNKDLDLISDLKGKIENIVIRRVGRRIA